MTLVLAVRTTLFSGCSWSPVSTFLFPSITLLDRWHNYFLKVEGIFDALEPKENPL